MSLAFVREIHWWLVNSPYKGPVMQKMFPFDGVFMLKLQKDTLQFSSKSYTECFEITVDCLSTVWTVKQMKNVGHVILYNASGFHLLSF